MAHRDVRGVAQALFKHKDIGLIDALQSFNAEFMFAPGCSRWALKRRTQGDDANPAFSRASSRLPENRTVFSPTYLENRPRCGWPPQDESSAAFKGTQGLNGYFVL